MSQNEGAVENNGKKSVFDRIGTKKDAVQKIGNTIQNFNFLQIIYNF